MWRSTFGEWQVAKSLLVVALQLKWELGSSVLGLLLRRYAPHDTYEVHSHMHSPDLIKYLNRFRHPPT